jgi:RimJ/RimL family protein N-acetyltransferase/ABC-type transporter Mla MlaB component
VQLYVDGDLTARTAPAFCEAAAEALASGERTVVAAATVKAVDAVGLAVLLQAARRAAQAGKSWSLIPSPVLDRALLEAGVADDIMLASADGVSESEAVRAVPPFPMPDHGDVLIAEPRLALRLPSWEDFAYFDRWAAEAMLEAMLGSTLLYRCRHLGAYHADVLPLISADPTALTALIVPPGEPPVGFARLYNVHLTEGFAFLETAIADRRALQHGWGVIASRLLLAYALDVLDLQRVETKVYAYNTLSVNALRRNGFRLEGRLREAREYDGRRWDMLVFALLREEMVDQRVRHGIPIVKLWPAPPEG